MNNDGGARFAVTPSFVLTHSSEILDRNTIFSQSARVVSLFYFLTSNNISTVPLHTQEGERPT